MIFEMGRVIEVIELEIRSFTVLTSLSVPSMASTTHPIWPTIPNQCVIFNQENVTNLEVPPDLIPFLALLQRVQILLTPSSPKLVSKMLHTSPSFPSIEVLFLENARWWKDNL